MDPRGFMSEEEKIREEENQLENKKEVKPAIVNGKEMEPEFGFKPKGPEPTRYGDWEVKGKCVDFWCPIMGWHFWNIFHHFSYLIKIYVFQRSWCSFICPSVSIPFLPTPCSFFWSSFFFCFFLNILNPAKAKDPTSVVPPTIPIDTAPPLTELSHA